MVDFPTVPGPLEDAVSWIRQAVPILQNISTGKINVNIVVTLLPGVATTTITDARIGFESNPNWVALTANAAAELGNGTMYVLEAGRVNGSLVITHANNAQADRSFRVSLLG